MSIAAIVRSRLHDLSGERLAEPDALRLRLAVRDRREVARQRNLSRGFMPRVGAIA